MAKKKEPTVERENDALIISKEEFKKVLKEQIEKAKAIEGLKISNQGVLENFQKEYKKWNDYTSEFLKHSFNNEDNEYKHSYDNVNFYTRSFRPGFTPDPIAEARKKISNKLEFLESLFDKADLLKSIEAKPEIRSETSNPTPVDSENIFIVHGHNHEIQQKLARTIEKLELKPIILSEQASSGATVIEKFEKYSNVGFAIVLLTGDDLGKAKNTSDLNLRARQNVILELGYFFGKLGRGRVLPLYEIGVDLPSDINGLVYTLIDSNDKWKFELVKELKAAGYKVDANKIL